MEKKNKLKLEILSFLSKENDAKLFRAKKVAYEQREMAATKEIQLDQLKNDYAQANRIKRKLIVKVSQYTLFRNYLEKVK